MDTSAPAPTNNFFIPIRTEQEKLHEDLNEKEELWAMLGDHPAYLNHGGLKEYVLNLIRGLGAQLNQAIERGADERELGMRVQVVKLVELNLMSIITKIEQTTKIHDKRARDVKTG